MKKTISRVKLSYSPREICFDGACLMLAVIANLIVWFVPEVYLLLMEMPVTKLSKSVSALLLLVFFIVCYPYFFNSSSVTLKPQANTFPPRATKDTFYI